ERNEGRIAAFDVVLRYFFASRLECPHRHRGEDDAACDLKRGHGDSEESEDRAACRREHGENGRGGQTRSQRHFPPFLGRALGEHDEDRRRRDRIDDREERGEGEQRELRLGVCEHRGILQVDPGWARWKVSAGSSCWRVIGRVLPPSAVGRGGRCGARGREFFKTELSPGYKKTMVLEKQMARAGGRCRCLPQRAPRAP